MVRQAGNVKQSQVSVQLIQGAQHNSATCELTGDEEIDLANTHNLINQLRYQLPHIPADPYLNYATAINNSEHLTTSTLPSTNDIFNTISKQSNSLDLVGIWASGTQNKGFANSLGQRNWFSTENFNFDWSVYHQEGKAVKMNYAGIQWDDAVLINKLENCRATLKLLSLDTITLRPGKYRVYLAPSALVELSDMLSWGGFDLKSHKTAQTPLIKMITDNKHLHSMVSINEDQNSGIGPNFTSQGFIKPEHVKLIQQGRYQTCLVDARSAKEYECDVNAANTRPSSINFAAGDIKDSDILSTLNTGIFINNLWYCNYSDRSNCRITGMTRYACYWVEQGNIIAPINVMRFDESIYNILGENLMGLTENRDFISDNSSYDFRSTSSSLLPGALVRDFTLTL